MKIIQPHSIEEAARQQIALYDAVYGPIPAEGREKVSYPVGKDYRTASMKPGYIMAHAPELGMGMFSTYQGVAHECEMKWFMEDGSEAPPNKGQVLLCTICWLDGT